MAKHKTATARAEEASRAWVDGYGKIDIYIKRALQLHAKAALARSKPKKKVFAADWTDVLPFPEWQCKHGPAKYAKQKTYEGACDRCAKQMRVFKK